MDNNYNHTGKFDSVRLDLSLEACEYLGGTTNGITIWSIYSELLNLLSHAKGNLTKRGIQIELSPGEIDCSVNSLRQRFGIGPKPMTKVINRFEELGLIRITPSKLASIADMVSVVGWTDADGYHELERNQGEQNLVCRDNRSDNMQKESLPLCKPQDVDRNPQIEEQQTPDACPTQTDSEQYSGADTSYNIHAREATYERDSEQAPASEERELPPTDNQPQTMTAMVSQMTGAANDFIIPSVVTLPQNKAKPVGNHSKGQKQAKSLAAKRSEKNR